MSLIRYLAPLSALAIIAGCGDSSPTESTLPVPSVVLSDTIPLTSSAPRLHLNLRVQAAAAVGEAQKIFGRGVITLNNIDRKFFFQAIRNPDGTVRGEFDFTNLSTGLTSSGRLSCFTIVGKTVYAAGLISKGEWLGFHAVWTATDNPDRFSGRFIALDPFHCINPFNLATHPLKSGSIIIKN